MRFPALQIWSSQALPPLSAAHLPVSPPSSLPPIRYRCSVRLPLRHCPLPHRCLFHCRCRFRCLFQMMCRYSFRCCRFRCPYCCCYYHCSCCCCYCCYCYYCCYHCCCYCCCRRCYCCYRCYYCRCYCCYCHLPVFPCPRSASPYPPSAFLYPRSVSPCLPSAFPCPRSVSPYPRCRPAYNPSPQSHRTSPPASVQPERFPALQSSGS